MVDVKIDLSKKTEAEVMALMADLTHYAHIISEINDVAAFCKESGYTYKDVRKSNINIAIEEFNNCIIKYCESEYHYTTNIQKSCDDTDDVLSF